MPAARASATLVARPSRSSTATSDPVDVVERRSWRGCGAGGAGLRVLRHDPTLRTPDRRSCASGESQNGICGTLAVSPGNPSLVRMTRLDTDAVHLGREDLAALGVHVPPLDLSTTYPLPGVGRGGESYERLATGGRPAADDSLVYQRLWNPNVDRFERSVAALEGLPEAVAFGTGMAALARCSLAASRRAARTSSASARCTAAPTTSSPAACSAPASPGPTPTRSPTRSAPTPGWSWSRPREPDRRPGRHRRRRRGQAGDVPVLVDNTFATPVLQQPAPTVRRWSSTRPPSSSAATAT